MRRSQVAVIILAALAAAPQALSAQDSRRFSRFEAGLELAVAQPVGDFADQIEAGGGATVHGAYRVSPVFSVRAEVTYLVYGHERNSFCGPGGCRVELDQDTNNQIVSAFFGPQVEVPSGPVRPYARAGVGVGYFFTSSSLSGTDGWDTFASTNNYDDSVLALMGGGGVRVPFSIKRVPVALDFGAQYQRNGDVSYLREGSITDNSDGSITLHPISGPADFVQWHLGLAVTIPHGRGHRR